MSVCFLRHNVHVSLGDLFLFYVFIIPITILAVKIDLGDRIVSYKFV